MHRALQYLLIVSAYFTAIVVNGNTVLEDCQRYALCVHVELLKSFMSLGLVRQTVSRA